MKLGVGIIVGAGVLAALLAGLWVVGLVAGVGGGLVHLLLLAAPAVLVAGVAVGVALIVAERRRK